MVARVSETQATTAPTPGALTGVNPARNRGIPWALALAVSFWGGLHIMLLEMCGFRVLQTHLGSSVVATGTLLTLVMILLAGGYYLGGRLSARTNVRTLLVVLAVSTLYTHFVTALFLEPMLDWATNLRRALRGYAFLRTSIPASALTLGLYGFPVFAMSMISPFLVGQYTQGTAEGDGAGRQAGFFMAVSTAGSIVGTLMSSYLLIPFWGVAVTALSSNAFFGVLVLIGILREVTPRFGRRRLQVALGAATLLTTAVATAVSVLGPDRAADVVYATESHYGSIRVTKETDDLGHIRLEYRPSSIYTHSVLYPDDPLRQTAGLVYLMPALLDPPKSVLVLGSAAGGVVRQFDAALPNSRVTAVDIDPEIHRVATEVFGVDPNKTSFVTADARAYLAENGQAFDYIIVDLFAGETLPPHCVTVEFFELVRSRLSARGSVFVNTNMNDIPHELPEDVDPFRPVRHLQQTLRAAGFASIVENKFFHSVYAFPRSDVGVAELTESLLARAASNQWPLAVRAAAGLAAYTTVSVPEPARSYRVFSDSWSPDLLIESKSNAWEIYGALKAHAPAVGSGGVEAQVSERVLAEVISALDAGNVPALNEPNALARRLNDLDAPVRRADVAIAARFSRFAPDSEAPDESVAQTPWARLALLYASIYGAAHANDYAALQRANEKLTRFLSPGGDGSSTASTLPTGSRG